MKRQSNRLAKQNPEFSGSQLPTTRRPKRKPKGTDPLLVPLIEPSNSATTIVSEDNSADLLPSTSSQLQNSVQTVRNSDINQTTPGGAASLLNRHPIAGTSRQLHLSPDICAVTPQVQTRKLEYSNIGKIAAVVQTSYAPSLDIESDDESTPNKPGIFNFKQVRQSVYDTFRSIRRVLSPPKLSSAPATPFTPYTPLVKRATKSVDISEYTPSRDIGVPFNTPNLPASPGNVNVSNLRYRFESSHISLDQTGPATLDITPEDVEDPFEEEDQDKDCVGHTSPALVNLSPEIFTTPYQSPRVIPDWLGLRESGAFRQQEVENQQHILDSNITSPTTSGVTYHTSQDLESTQGISSEDQSHRSTPTSFTESTISDNTIESNIEDGGIPSDSNISGFGDQEDSSHNSEDRNISGYLQPLSSILDSESSGEIIPEAILADLLDEVPPPAVDLRSAREYSASVSTSNGSGIAPGGLPEMQGSQSSNSYASTSESEPPQRATEVGPETLLQLKNMFSELVSRKLAKLTELTRANRNDVETMKTAQENILGGLNHLIQRLDDFALLQNLVWKELEQLKTEVTGLRARQDEDLQYQQDSGTPIPSPSELQGKRKGDSPVSVLSSGISDGAATPNENVGYETTWSVLTSSDSRVFVPSPTSSSCSVNSYLNLRSGVKKKARYTRRRNKHGINGERK